MLGMCDKMADGVARNLQIKQTSTTEHSRTATQAYLEVKYVSEHSATSGNRTQHNLDIFTLLDE